MGSGVNAEDRLAYTNTTIFETFPFPLTDSRDPFAEDEDSSGAGLRARHSLPRNGGQGRPPHQEIEAGGDSAPPLQARYEPRIVPDTPQARRVSKVAEELYLKRQAACIALNLGLTKLYNYIKGKSPLGNLSTEHQALVTELQALHERLNDAVCACYGWSEGAWRDENEVLKRLLALNLALTREDMPIS